MKKIITVLFFISILLTVKAQNNKAYSKGKVLFNANYFYAPEISNSFYLISASSTPFLPTLSFEYGFTNKISLGLIGGYFSKNEILNEVDETQTKFYLIALKGAYHFSTLKKLDPFVGLKLGYVSKSTSFYQKYSGGFTYSSGSKGGILLGLTCGANYYFTSNIGVNAEIGYGSLINNTIFETNTYQIPSASFGLSFKF